ncbi:MAG: TMEM165/GDT1 family protein [Alphaproteobacteria bacterium]
MESFLVSTGIVALAEIGDKTQLLALVLTAQLKKPWAVVAGILIATLANHALAALIGHHAQQWIPQEWLRWILGIGFLAVAAWTLIPDKLDDADAAPVRAWGAFLTTLVAFFLVEMGDKTQIATIGLAARFADYWPVLLGTTAGMMLANAPVVLIGNIAGHKLPLTWIRRVAALGFAAIGVAALLGVEFL